MFGLDKQSRLNRSLRSAAYKGDVVALDAALNAGAEINAHGSTKWGGSALHLAALQGKYEAARLLLDRGADVNLRDRTGETPLSNALIREHYKLATLLLDRGASTDVVGPSGRTPLSLVAKSRNKELIARVAGVPPQEVAPVPAAVPAPAQPARNDGPDDVVFYRPLGNRVLEETYNFAAKERITLLRNGLEGPVEAMTRESFDSLGNKAALRHAFEIYAGRGGAVHESEIFPDAPAALPKPKIQPGKVQ